MLVDDENLDRPAAAVNSFYVREKKNTHLYSRDMGKIITAASVMKLVINYSH